MKKVYTVFAAVLLCASLAGCKKFLDLPARNEQTIETLEDVRALLGSYLAGVASYPTTALGQIGMKTIPLFSSRMKIMFESYSDNLDFNKALPETYLKTTIRYPTPPWEDYRRLLLWSDYTTPKAIWDKYYDLIGYLNTLIDEVDAVKAGNLSETERDLMKGEMLIHRAYYFFKLLQYFAPYTDNAMGIPVYLGTNNQVLGVQKGRSSHTEVYKTILADLAEAERLLETTTPRETFNIFFRGERLFHIMAQVYWFKGDSPAAEATDWDNAAKYARKVIDLVPESAMPKTSLEMLRTFCNAPGALTGYPGFYMQTSNSAAEFQKIYGSPNYYLGVDFQPQDIPVSQEFFDLFRTGDIRLGELFSTGYGGGWSGYFQGDVPTLSRIWADPNPTTLAVQSARGRNMGYVMLFKPEEAYLILAEALYHTGGDATTALDKFKSFRNSGGTGLSGEALYRELLDERRREFFTDSDKRWLDLKKYAAYTGTTIVRDLTFPLSDEGRYNGNDNQAYRAEPNDYKYALPIPMDSELQGNPNLTQNPGWTQSAF